MANQVKKLYCKHCKGLQEYSVKWDERKRARAKCLSCQKWIRRIPRKGKEVTTKEIKYPKLRKYLETALNGQFQMHTSLPMPRRRTYPYAVRIHANNGHTDLINQLLGCLTSEHVVKDIVRIAKEEGIIDDTISEDQRSG